MLNTGNALALPFGENEFDAAYMIYVGMNIADKNQLIGEAARVIKPGGHFVIYDVMQMRSTLPYPLPWSEAETEKEKRSTLDLGRIGIGSVGHVTKRSSI